MLMSLSTMLNVRVFVVGDCLQTGSGEKDDMASVPVQIQGSLALLGYANRQMDIGLGLSMLKTSMYWKHFLGLRWRKYLQVKL
ncbi:protein of unknown function [Xenorhabdus bovienii]|uniref:Uncharacterized protein n=1 Tax=Xenorhabdus bovienii TaxID=40576 RepID=A0A0B6X5L7_XENBV|nr:protein of unknown function [Xenorhabdus bovienii]